MYPIMRKTKTPPDPMVRMRLYSFLTRQNIRDEKCVNIIGNNYPTEDSADFVRMLRGAGSVSYTHLDVYKRQSLTSGSF